MGLTVLAVYLYCNAILLETKNALSLLEETGRSELQVEWKTPFTCAIEGFHIEGFHALRPCHVVTLATIDKVILFE